MKNEWCFQCRCEGEAGKDVSYKGIFEHKCPLTYRTVFRKKTQKVEFCYSYSANDPKAKFIQLPISQGKFKFMDHF